MNKLLPLGLLLLACPTAGWLPAATTIRFQDATASSGIQFIHTDGSSGNRYIIENIASGLGLIDFDGDGLLDIYFLNGAPLPGSPVTATPPVNTLYRNNGDGTFTDVTASSGTGDPGYALGCAVADYNNNGHEDIFITNFGRNTLLRNNGDGTFTDVTEYAGLGDTAFGAGCAFLDFDRDGHLDLYVANYLHFDFDAFQPCTRAGVPVYCDPRTYPPVADRLYRNRGDGTFEDVSERSGIGRYRGYGMGMVCSDFDGDGWPDIFVGNDVMQNYLFRNRRDGTFEEMGLLAGVAFDQFGDEQGTMGANAGDYDGDGLPDIVITDYQNQVTTLYRNLGNSLFQDVTVATGVGVGSLPLVTWGCGFVDLNNDGKRELFTAAGHLQDTVEQYDNSSTYRQRNILLQQREGRFVDISKAVGGPLNVVESSRGAVFGDLTNNGLIDIVVSNARSRPTIMFNQSPSSNHWAILKLVGQVSNRSAVGAVVRLTAGGQTQVDEVRAGRGYQSADDLRLHFGLGTQAVIDRIEVRWPTGKTNVWTQLDANRVIRLTENSLELQSQ
jgi:enediyne biosynthesis protein E4